MTDQHPGRGPDPQMPQIEKTMTQNIRSTSRSLPIALLRARETVMGPLREMLAKSGISEQKWRVLRVLNEKGPSEHSAIAEAACLLLPSLTRMLATLEAEGLVTRAGDPKDRRKTLVTISTAGQDLIFSHLETSNAIFAQLEKQFGRGRLDQLLDLLDDLQKVALRG